MPSRWSRRGDRGAVAIVLALVTTMVLVPLAGLAVDLGVQRVARRDMQSLADVVALDLARQLDGKTTAAQWATRTPSLQTLAEQSRDRNTSTAGAAPSVTPTLGTVATDGTFTALSATSTTVPTAVRVATGTSVGFGFMPGSGPVARSAVGVADSSACFDLGSYAAAVKSGDSTLLAPLNSIFGLNTSLLSYQGLGNTSVRLSDLAADSHIGGVDKLFTTGVSYSSVVQAMIDLLDKSDSSYSVALSALQAIAKVSGDFPQIKLANLMNIAPTDTAALQTRVSILNILTGGVLVADGGSAVDVQGLWAHVAGLGNIAGVPSLKVIQGKQRACGAPNSDRAQATSSQLSGEVDFGDLNTPSVNIPGLATLQTSPATGVLTVGVGNAQGRLIAPPAVHCGDGTAADPDTYSVSVSSSLSSISLTSDVSVTGSVKLDLGALGLGGLLGGLGGLLGTLTKVDLNIVVHLGVSNTGSAQPNKQVDLAIPGNDSAPAGSGPGVVLSTATVQASIDPSSTAMVGAVSLPLGSLTAAVLNPIINGLIGPTAPFMTNTLSPLVNNINTLLTGPISKLLGATLAGADVYAVPRPVCSVPRLAG